MARNGFRAEETILAVDAAEAGRAATARHAWNQALSLLSEADALTPLDAEDLNLLAQAAWWMGRMRQCISASERAHIAYVEQGDRRSAALMAARLGKHHVDLLEMSVAGAWFKRAEELLEDQPDCIERGHLALLQGLFNNRADADALVTQAINCATRFGDRDLLGLALSAQGGRLVRQGEVERGMALLEDATSAAVSSELGPYATGWIYCLMISASSDVSDWQRAAHWADVAKRWFDRQAIRGFPGVCRVHRAEIMRVRGAFHDAEVEALAAAAELEEFSLLIAGRAFYELGEVRLRTGDLDAAEEAFRQAHERGRSPQPGLALALFRRGRTEAAANAIRRALEDPGIGPLGRAKLLPAQVEIALAGGRPDEASAAGNELRMIATSFSSAAICASAEAAAAAIALAAGELGEAAVAAKRARHLWMEAGVTYEAARVCMLIGEIHAGEGDHEAAKFEFETARSTFERLGAAPDAAAASGRIDALERAGRRVAKTFLFSDIVDSTKLLEAIGDEAWSELLAWHDAALRRFFRQYGGQDADHLGDGFFVVFETADEAVACAMTIQRWLYAHRRTHGFAPRIRIGIHSADATEDVGGYRGKGVHEAARIGALADGGEILISVATAGSLAEPIALSDIRFVTLKGISAQVETGAVVWQQE